MYSQDSSEVGKVIFSEGEYDIVNIALAFKLNKDVELPNWGQHAEDLTTQAKIISILSLSPLAFPLSLSLKWSHHHQGDVTLFYVILVLFEAFLV